LSQNTSSDDLGQQSPNEINSLGMNSNVNSDAISPQETAASGPNDSAPPTPAANEVEVDINNEGVKSMSGPKIPEDNNKVAATETSQSQPPQQPPAQTATATATAGQGGELNAAELTKTEDSEQQNQSAQTVSAEGANADLLPADTGIEELTKMAKDQEASDIHFTAKYPVMFRKDGELYPVTKPISEEQSQALAESLMTTEAKRKTFKKEKEVDFSFTNEGGIRFRVNLYTERGNSAGALRLIATKIRTVEELELPPIFKEITKEPHGLVLVVGPTGSGKSTTLAAMINHINLHRREHIITIEDPIEYVYPIGKSIVQQRELEADTMSWNAALKSALREDPNVVLVGEMRDLATIESTIRVAETGHLVFATLHTNSASQSIDRIIDVFPEGSKEQIRAQLASVIAAVISQRLIPVKGGGRRAALEIMLGSGAVKNAIREGKTYQIDNIIQTSGDIGMLTLEKSLVDMVKKGYITADQAREYSVKPDDIDSLLSG
jgi:twitching motility protein PilT